MKSNRTIEVKFKAIFIVVLLFLGITITPAIIGSELLAQSIITTYAGGDAIQLVGSQTITQVGIGNPYSVISDRSGGFYFTTSDRVYRVGHDGSLSLIAGSGAATFDGDAGIAASTQLADPFGIALDANGNLFIADSGNHRLRKVTPLGVITTVAGTGIPSFGGDDGQAAFAQLASPKGVALDRDGNIFIADSNNQRIRKVTPSGIITTVAGNGVAGLSGDGGPATSAELRNPTSLAVDADGNLFIGDSGNNRVRKVTPTGIITTIVGDGPNLIGDGGPAVSATLKGLQGIALDAGGNLYIADGYHNLIRKVTVDGLIHTVAGSGLLPGFIGDGAPATSLWLWYPRGIGTDADGNLLIADTYNHRIRKLTPSGFISTVAGNAGFAGDVSPGVFSEILQPSEVVIDSDGNLFIADTGNSRIARISAAGNVSTFAGNGNSDGDGGPATSAKILFPTSVALGTSGNMFTVTGTNDLSGEGRVRSIDSSGIIRSIAAPTTRWKFFDYDGEAPAGEVCIAGIAVDGAGNLYVAETLFQVVWKITPSGAITRFAGDGSGIDGYSGDGGPATSAKLSFPNGLAFDRNGNLFIADAFNNVVRRVTPSGIITTVAGNGTGGFSGDGGPATSAALWYPLGVALDENGNLFIADSHNNRIRMVTPTGIIATVAGNGTRGFKGDGGPATSAELNYPTSIAVDHANLFIADYGNNRIRKVPLGVGLTVFIPNSGGRSNVINVTLIGMSFDPTLKINPIDGITVSNLAVVSPTSATATFIIAPDTLPGTRSVTVTTAAGTSNSATFTVNPPPGITSLVPPVAVPGTAVVVALTGTGFGNGMTVDAGSGIAVSNVNAASTTSATATFTIASGAALGARNVIVTTPDGSSVPATFNVVLPFPDLAITSTHSANFGVGFTETYNILVRNVGLVSTTGAITITDVLSAGLSFVSGGGSAWSCTAVGQTVTCSSSGLQGPGAATALNLNVAVSSAAAPGVVHVVSVATAGDVDPSNDIASEVTTVAATPVPNFVVTPSALGPGEQATVGLTLSTAFPHDVTGSITLGFSSNAAIPLDDPAIQFASGGRQTTFIIPANSLAARIGESAATGPIGFQTGTVAGSLSFTGTLQAGTVQTTFSPSVGVASELNIPKQAPSIQSLKTTTQNGFAVLIGLWSTTREVAQFSLTFNTTPAVSLSCGSVSGCSVSGSTMTFDVQSLFKSWFDGDTTFGSLSTLRLPLSISGPVHGTVTVSLRNSIGISNSVPFVLP